MADYKKWVPIFIAELNEFMKTAPAISEVHKNDHIKRVWKTSLALCTKFGGDPEIMVAAVFLHDLGRHHGLEIHGEKSVELAKPVLQRLGFPREKIDLVLDAIQKHDYSTPNSERVSVYSKILYDADKLDAFGKIGIKRHIKFYLNRGKTVQEILKMIEKRWGGLTLAESKEVGRKEYELTKQYFIDLQKRQNKVRPSTKNKSKASLKLRRRKK